MVVTISPLEKNKQKAKNIKKNKKKNKQKKNKKTNKKNKAKTSQKNQKKKTPFIHCTLNKVFTDVSLMLQVILLIVAAVGVAVFLYLRKGKARTGTYSLAL